MSLLLDFRYQIYRFTMANGWHGATAKYWLVYIDVSLYTMNLQEPYASEVFLSTFIFSQKLLDTILRVQSSQLRSLGCDVRTIPLLLK